MKKHLLVKLLATTLACLFVLTGFIFPVSAAETTNDGDLGDKLVAMNIAMNGQVSLLLYFKNVENVSYFSVECPNQGGITTATQVPVSELIYDEAKDRYCLEVSVAAAQQSDTIKVQSFDANGNGGKVRSYSIRDYADMVFALAEKDPDTYLLASEALKSMLNYGAMAQIAFGYNTDNLANEGLYAEGTNPVYGMSLSDMINAPDWGSTLETTGTFFFSSATAVLTGKAALKLYVAYDGDYSKVSLKVSGGSNRDDGRDVYVDDILYQEGSNYYAQINNIPATKYNNLYPVELTDGTTTIKGSFSMLNYAQILFGDGSNEVLANAACAMYHYYVWTTAYVNGAKLGTTDIEKATEGLVKTDCTHSRTYIDLVGVPGRTCSDCGHFFAGYRLLDENDENYPEYAIEGYWGNRNSYYNATGYDSVSLAGLNFGSSLTISNLYNKDETSTSFNRFSISYYAAQPTKITVNYTVGSSAKETYYYLEKGEHTFYAVLPEFTAGTKATKINSITAEACEGGDSSTFVLFDYTLEDVTVPGATITLTSGSQTLSIGRDVGFAMTALTRSGIGNPSDFISDNQYSWQSEALRIIDVQVSSTEVYGKVQHGETYYEITYTANGDSIISTNTITDYSGADTGFATYSLPSLYVPNTMTGFSYYDGLSHWSNGTLTSTTNTSDTHNFRYSAQECWVALNRGTNAAIGIYLPGVDSVEVGTSGSYRYASLQKTFRVAPYETAEFKYLVATNTTVANVRATFVANKNFTENNDLSKDCVCTRIPDAEPNMTDVSFVSEQSNLLLRDATNAIVRYSDTDCSAGVIATGNAPSVCLDFLLYDHVTGYTTYSAQDFVQLRIKYMIPAESGNQTCTIYLNDTTALGTVTLTADGTYRTEVINISSITSGNTTTIKNLKLSFDSATAGTEIYTRGIQLLTNENRFVDADFIPEIDMSDLITVYNTTMSFDKTENAIKLINTNNDPYFIINYAANGLNLDASKYNTAKFTYMIPTTNTLQAAYYCDLRLTVDGVMTTVRLDCLEPDGEYHTLIVDISKLNLSGTLTEARLDYLDFGTENNGGDVMYLQSFILSANTLENEITSIDFTERGSNRLLFTGASRFDELPDWKNYFAEAYRVNAFFPATNISQAGITHDATEGALKFQAPVSVENAAFDPYVTINFMNGGITAAKYSGIRIKYMIPAECSDNQSMQIFTFPSSQAGFSQVGSLLVPLQATGEYVTLDVDLSVLGAYWTGDINMIRLDFMHTYYNGELNAMYIASIELIPAQ